MTPYLSQRRIDAIRNARDTFRITQDVLAAIPEHREAITAEVGLTGKAWPAAGVPLTSICGSSAAADALAGLIPTTMGTSRRPDRRAVPTRRPTEAAGGALSDPAFARRIAHLLL